MYLRAPAEPIEKLHFIWQHGAQHICDKMLEFNHPHEQDDVQFARLKLINEDKKKMLCIN